MGLPSKQRAGPPSVIPWLPLQIEGGALRKDLVVRRGDIYLLCWDHFLKAVRDRSDSEFGSVPLWGYFTKGCYIL